MRESARAAHATRSGKTLIWTCLRRTNEIVVEKRKSPRAALAVEVTCRRPDGSTVQARSRDISMGGMYLETREPVAFGESLTLDFRLPSARGALSLPAVVRWTDPGGFGVQFGLLGARETHAISSLLHP